MRYNAQSWFMLMIIGPNSKELEKFILDFSGIFALKDLRVLPYFLRIKVSYPESNIYLSQKKYIRDLLNKVDMLEWESYDTPMVAGSMLQKEFNRYLGSN